MPHFFISSKNVQNDFVILDDKETLKHLVGSLRVKVGEKLKFIDENANLKDNSDVVNSLKSIYVFAKANAINVK